MTTSQPAPTNQNCPACGALVFYEGHSELRAALTPHRFHCHRCGKLYVVRSTSHKPPKFRLTPRHEVLEPALTAGAEHGEALVDETAEDDEDTPLAAETAASESEDQPSSETRTV